MIRILTALLTLATLPLRADVLLTVDWGSTTAVVPRDLAGLNGWSAMQQSIATNASYQDKLDDIYPRFFRLHAAEMLDLSSAKCWLNSNGSWNSSRINAILNAVSDEVESICINIPKWSPTLASGSSKLPSSLHDSFATWCASLVTIVKNGGHTKVRWFEVLNELDGLYNGDSAGLATLTKKASAKMRAANSAINICGGQWTQPYDDADMQAFMSAVTTTDIQGFSYHHYGTASDNITLAEVYERAETVGTRTGDIRGWMNARGHTNSLLFLGETNIFASWTLDSGKNWMQSNEGAVFLALALRKASFETVGGLVAANLILPWNDADGVYGAMSESGGTYALRQPGQLLRHYGSRFDSGSFCSSSSASSNIRASAIRSGTERNLLIINKSTTTQIVDLSFANITPTSSYREITISSSGTTDVTKTWSGAPQNISMSGSSIKFFYFTD
jgi:hypothetical protein